ncbi:MAG TPA: DNA polymerase III subunit delta' [Thermodesulfovibrionales bacterium]|nr:DNA polymerase III subunit delta' [Thermodesulfovibrionales bacterium]
MALQDIIGQEKAVNILLRTIQRERVPSSYLFAGESGIGKKFTALNLAKALNCQSREQRAKSKENTPSLTLPHQGGGQVWGIDCCDECSSCRKIESGSHPDFLLIAPHSGQIRIEEIRAIDDTLSLKPFEGKWKIVIVDEAHMMNSFAANAFLKTLEEPPKESLIILISSNPDRLPDTIRSRCSRLNFTPLSNEACIKVIETVISQKSNPPSPPFTKGGRRRITQKTTAKKQETEGSRPASLDSQLSTLVRLCMGRPGLAISGDLVEERKWFLELLTEMMRAEKDGWASKEEIERWLNQIVLLLRDAAVIQITHDEKNLINIDMKDYIKKFSSSMDLQGIIDNYQQLKTLMGYLNFNLNKSLTWNYTGSLLRRIITEQ